MKFKEFTLSCKVSLCSLTKLRISSSGDKLCSVFFVNHTEKSDQAPDENILSLCL